MLQSIEPCRITVENRLLGRRADFLVLAQLTDFFLHGVSVHFMRKVGGKDERSFAGDFDAEEARSSAVRAGEIGRTHWNRGERGRAFLHCRQCHTTYPERTTGLPVLRDLGC